MRICSPHCGIDPETTSGGETYEREILKRLAARGTVIDILLARHKRHPEHVPNWVIHRLPMGRGLRWPVAAVVLPPFIRRTYGQTRFDLLRVHSLRYIGPAALIARHRYRLDVPVVAHHHHLDPSWLNPVIERRVMHGAERVIVGSEFARTQAASALGVPLEKFAVVYYGVDERFRRKPKPPTLLARYGLEGKDVVLFLGGLKRRKNLFFLLEVWREVARARPEVRLLVAGSGSLAAALARRAVRLGIGDCVVFTGYVPESEKPDLYNLADVVFSPSSMEGFGLTVAEGMSSEVPVVVSDRGSLPELVADDEEGFLCDPTDRDGFARKLLLLLSDPMLRRKLGAAGRQKVDRCFRWDRCAEATQRIYDDVVDAWRRSPRKVQPPASRAGER